MNKPTKSTPATATVKPGAPPQSWNVLMHLVNLRFVRSAVTVLCIPIVLAAILICFGWHLDVGPLKVRFGPPKPDDAAVVTKGEFPGLVAQFVQVGTEPFRNTGEGPVNAQQRHISFKVPFKTVPKVALAVESFGTPATGATNVDVTTENVTPNGFDIVFDSHGVRMDQICLTWIASVQ